MVSTYFTDMTIGRLRTSTGIYIHNLGRCLHMNWISDRMWRNGKRIGGALRISNQAEVESLWHVSIDMYDGDTCKQVQANVLTIP